MFKLEGTIKVIKDTVQVTDKFSKREFVINDASSQYPQDILFQSVQDKCAMLDGFMEGENVEVSFNLRGREWTSPQGEVKYFNTLDAWRIEKVGPMVANNAGSAPKNADPVLNKPNAEAPATTEEEDDLPF